MKRTPSQPQHRKATFRSLSSGKFIGQGPCAQRALHGAQSAHPAPRFVRGGRVGATLTEVLIALLVMSIGVVSVATMFPLSMVRAIKATQLTNAAILRLNAEAMYRADSSIAASVPNPADTDPPKFGIVDPLGWNLVTSSQGFFGNNLMSLTGAGNGITRYNAGRNNEGLADYLVTLPDSWSQKLQLYSTTAAPITVAGNGLSVALPTAAATDLAQFTIPGTVLYRVLVFNQDGQSQSRTLTGLTGSTISWDAALPSKYQGATVPEVRIEAEIRRYTWLATVRKTAVPGGTPPYPPTINLDIVVVFNRSFQDSEEQAYVTQFQLQSDQATVQFPAGKAPYLKKGSYVFDATNAQWYRIQNVSAIDSGTTQATIALDRPAVAAGSLGVFIRGVVDVYPIQ